jgi:hypothetical protein
MSSIFLCAATLYDCLLNKGLRVRFGVVELHFEICCTSLGQRTQTPPVPGSRFRKSGISFRMRAFYGDRFVLPLPAGHRFLMQKYYLLRECASPSATLLYSVPPPGEIYPWRSRWRVWLWPRHRRHRRYSSPDHLTCRRRIRRQTQRGGTRHALFGEIHLKRFETQ